MKTLCQITTQYYERYTTDNWKPKGGQVFNVMVDPDDFMYSENVCVETIKEILKSYSGDRGKFEYVYHELVFYKPINILESRFEKIFTEKAKSYYKG